MIFYAMLVVVLFCLLIPPKTDADLYTWQNIKEHRHKIAKTTY